MNTIQSSNQSSHSAEFVSQLSPEEQVILEEHKRLSSQILFKIIRQEGEEELTRSLQSLAFSALAAGIFVSFSFFFRSVFYMYTTHTVVTSFGYTVGFIIVILGRMQLFTENPITTMVPLLSEWSWSRLLQVLRLWTIVFLFNVLGTALAAYFLTTHYAVSPDLAAALHAVASHIMSAPAPDNIIRGIPAGILIAAIVWAMPQAGHFSLFMIMFFIYFISLGGFAHVIVGSCEMAYEIFLGQATLCDGLFRFLLPTGLGNILGGTVVFTLLIYGQISKEIRS
ncbi:formate/nitrite transporter family protein [Megasphaera vaginalis (ex Srinivasan et al. 2021)]|uniref:Formate/nitrite transporter n=1 Tax=Megasphaera vaginalis (ex Srinivasan et al. 2021) TaxID=1111454 RepID=U7UNE6_9FIRM|nr:formate/nitrite transporter family protein [Megasphaera vaginalis (ex Srinivasan et al. 2021)]ERT60008.1 formate/nitrite transporter [Megasphaera vaginalis (ex Srinivasan et al. 2021)]